MENSAHSAFIRDLDSRTIKEFAAGSEWEYLGAVEITDPEDDLIEMDFYLWVIRDGYDRIHLFSTDYGKFIHLNRTDALSILQNLPSSCRIERIRDLQSLCSRSKSNLPIAQAYIKDGKVGLEDNLSMT